MTQTSVSFKEEEVTLGQFLRDHFEEEEEKSPRELLKRIELEK